MKFSSKQKCMGFKKKPMAFSRGEIGAMERGLRTGQFWDVRSAESGKANLYSILRQIISGDTQPWTCDIVLFIIQTCCDPSRVPDPPGLRCWWLPNHLALISPHVFIPKSSIKMIPPLYIFINFLKFTLISISSR